MKKQPVDPALGKAITIRRVEMGLSRNELRDRCGLSYPYVAELEKGTKSPSARALEAIAGALEMRPHELMARAERLADAATPPHEAESSTPSVASPDWFGPASAPIRAERPLHAPPRARMVLAAPAVPVTEERVREIVREELRRLIAEAAQ
jgi:transcriptional regulator with XRE-family HTH domain